MASQNSEYSTLRHVAIIMDGNGRWAQERNRPRIFGHHEGGLRVDEIVTMTAEVGIPYLTLYAFSSENWNRPAQEVSLLMRLFAHHLRSMDSKLLKNRIRLVAQGNLEKLPGMVRDELDRVTALTNFENPNMTLNLALSYGGRQEIAEGAKLFAKRCLSGEAGVEDLDETSFRQYLYHPEIPDPDLLIRTGGEFRVSNFLLWQIAYAEIYVTPHLWPDFKAEQYREALDYFQTRERRFGKTGEQVEKTPKSPSLEVSP